MKTLRLKRALPPPFPGGRADSQKWALSPLFHEGNGPDLTVKYGATPNDPNGQPSIGNTNASISVVGIEPMPAPFEDWSSGTQYGGYKGATVTISNKIKGDKGRVEGTMAHEIGHVHDARTNTNIHGKQSQYTKQTGGAKEHDKRPEEKTANLTPPKQESPLSESKPGSSKKKRENERRIMNKRFVSWVPLLCMISLCFTQLTSGQSGGLETSETSLRGIAEELRSEFGPVRFERQEQLEDRYFVSGTSRAALELMPKLYQVQSTRFDETGTERLPPNLPATMQATSADGSRTYRLAGFEDVRNHSTDWLKKRLFKRSSRSRMRCLEDCFAQR